MYRDQLQNINPNRLHGCHPLDLQGVFGDHPFHLIAEKPNTHRNAAASLKQFLHFYGVSGKQHIEQMAREDIEAFTEDLQDRGLKPVTVSNRLRTVYAFVRFLIEEKVLGYELLERKIRIKLPDRLPRAINPEDLNRLLSAIDQVRDRAMILLLLRTGMRIGELLNTKVHDLDLNNHTSLEVTRIYARLTDKTRENEYFMAIEQILRGDPDADDACDY